MERANWNIGVRLGVCFTPFAAEVLGIVIESGGGGGRLEGVGEEEARERKSERKGERGREGVRKGEREREREGERGRRRMKDKETEKEEYLYWVCLLRLSTRNFCHRNDLKTWAGTSGYTP